MQRRSFLKLLSLTTGSVLVSPGLLLGVTGDCITHRDPRLASNWVVYPSRKLGDDFGCLSLKAREYVISPTFQEGVDPHEVFLKAALELQRRIGEETLRLIVEIPQAMRNHIEVVTNVFMPIHTRTKHCFAAPTEHLTEDDFVGFDVVADLSIEIKGWGIRDRCPREGGKFGQGWVPAEGVDVFSRVGEYPMELPNNIDLGHLMHVASLHQNGDVGLKRRLGRILIG